MGAFVEKIGGGWFKVGDVTVKCHTSNSGFLKNEITWEEYYDMDYDRLKKLLIKHEDEKFKPYKCTAGKLTIGIGHNLDDKGISKAVSDLLYKEDITEVIEDLHNIFNDFESLPENIQLVLADMRFQLGSSGFRKFKQLINAVNNHNWVEMIKQMKDSNWFKQVPNRANDLINMVLAV